MAAKKTKSFGKTPEDDRLFALGYPHIVVPTDDPMPDVTTATLYKKFPVGTTHVPRAFLGRYFKAIGCGAWEEGIAAALAKDPPAWTPPRVTKAIRDLLEESGDAYRVYLLEGLVGSDALALAITDVLESYPARAWDGAGGKLDTFGGDVLEGLYFVLLRTTIATRKKVRARLRKLLARAKKAGYQGGRPCDALDTILGGAKGVERSGYRDADEHIFQDLMYADDDPKYVERLALAELERMKPSDYASFDLRIAYLGGPKVLAAMKASTAKFPRDQKSDIKRQLARLA